MYEKDVAVIAGVLMLAGFSYCLSCYECENHPVYGTGQGCGSKVSSHSAQVKEVQCSSTCMISKDLVNGDYIFYRGCGCTEVNNEKSVVRCCSSDRCNADLESASREVTAAGVTLHHRWSLFSISLYLGAVLLTTAVATTTTI